MNTRGGNLSFGERAVSGGAAAVLSWLAMRRGSPLLRLVAGTAAAGLALRAAAGHCSVKAALRGDASLPQAVREQSRALKGEWKHLASKGRQRFGRASALHPRGHAEHSARVDESVMESFPASDAPASRLPDEPPSNANAKWAAARAAGQTE